MAYDAELVDRIRKRVGSLAGVTELKMFGGWGVTIHGNMAVGVMDSDLIVRVGPDGYANALKRTGARPFDFTGRNMTGWVYVDAGALTNGRTINRWIDEGTSYARTLPPKTARRRAPARPRRNAAM
jgi:TfoX/Sxy family transcriptional regulator of competence genes